MLSRLHYSHDIHSRHKRPKRLVLALLLLFLALPVLLAYLEQFGTRANLHSCTQFKSSLAVPVHWTREFAALVTRCLDNVSNRPTNWPISCTTALAAFRRRVLFYQFPYMFTLACVESFTGAIFLASCLIFEINSLKRNGSRTTRETSALETTYHQIASSNHWPVVTTNGAPIRK